MNNCDKYIYLYTDSHGRLNTATNPVFIARHKSCRAIPKTVLAESSFSLVSDFVYAVNCKDKEATELAKLYGLDEILILTT